MVGFLWFKLWNCYSRSIRGIVTVFQFILSRKSKYSFNLYQDSTLSQGNNSTNQPIPVNKDSFTSQMITLWELSPARAWADTFFRPMSIPLKMVEAGRGPGRTLCTTVTNWMPGVKTRLQCQYVRTVGNVAWGYFEPYWLPPVCRNEMTGAELVDWHIWYSMPLWNTPPATCGGGMLGNEYRMPSHRGLFTIIFRNRLRYP